MQNNNNVTIWIYETRTFPLLSCPFSASSFRISLCLAVEKNMYELLNRLGALGAFLNLAPPPAAVVFVALLLFGFFVMVAVDVI